MLTAYLDESGQETNKHVFIAGFLGNDDQWKELAAKWKVGLGKRKGLHMAELRWTKTHRIKKLLDRLGPIPHECNLEPVLGGVRVSDYEDLVKGTIDEQLLSGYIAALYPLIVQTLRWIPKNERLELILEAQERYEPFANIVLSNIANNPVEAEMMTDEGKSKLANWRFVPKYSTMLTEPADYFVYALTQIYRNKKSERAQLCMPIMRDGDRSEAVGAILSRAQVRGVIEATRMFINWEMISGINLKPKTQEELARFKEMVQKIINWRANEKKS